MIRTAFDHELSEVEQALVQMYRDVDQALGRALRAYEYAQRYSAHALIAADNAINERRAGVEEAVLRLIARQQPIARDLRVCIAAIAVAADLERIGDYAAGVAALVLRDTPTPTPIPELHDLSRQVRALLYNSMAAIVQRDTTAQQRLAIVDDAIDIQYEQLFRHTITCHFVDEATLRHHVYGLFVAHNLERIADRAVNIAERAAWVSRGTRHK